MTRRGAAGRALVVARRDYARTVRRRGFVVATTLVPLLFVGFGLVAALVGRVEFMPRRDGAAQVVLVNESDLQLPAAGAMRGIRLVVRDEALRIVRDGEAPEAYVIPPDYQTSGRVDRIVPTASRDVGNLGRRATQEHRIEDVLRVALLTGYEVPDDVTARLLEPLDVRDVTLDGSTPEPGIGGLLGLAFPYALAVLFVISIFATSGYLLQSVTEEKENRVVEILLSSVPAQTLMTGKILGLGAAGLTQIAVWAVVGLGIVPLLGLGAALTTGPFVVVVALAYFVLGYLAYGALFAAVGAIAPGTREAQQYSAVFAIPALVPIMASGLFVVDPSSPVLAALALFPLTAPVAGLQVIALRAADPPFGLILLSLGILAVFAVLAVAASARVFRATVLLYGVRPSVRTLARALLGRT